MSFFHSDTINLTFRLTQTQKLTETETETETEMESATFIFRSVASIMREDYILAASENNVSSSDNGAERRVDHYSIHTVYSCMQTTCYIPIHQSICQFVCVSVFWSVTPFLTFFLNISNFLNIVPAQMLFWPLLSLLLPTIMHLCNFGSCVSILVLVNIFICIHK